MSHTDIIPCKFKTPHKALTGIREIYLLKVLIQALQYLAMEVGHSRTSVGKGRYLGNCSMTHIEGCCQSLIVYAPTHERCCFKPEYRCLMTLISSGTIRVTRHLTLKAEKNGVIFLCTGRWTWSEKEEVGRPWRRKQSDLKQWCPGSCKLRLAESLEQVVCLLKEHSSNWSFWDWENGLRN